MAGRYTTSGRTPGARVTSSGSGREVSARRAGGAFLLACPIALVWVIWALRDGGYFSSAWYPGALLIFTLLAAVLATRGGVLALRTPAAWSVVCMTALGAWTLTSMLWSPARDTAFEDAQRTFLYAATLALALAIGQLSARRSTALAILTLPGIVVAWWTVAALGLGVDPELLFDAEGTLDFPLGYRNAVAAFFLVFIWPALSLASQRGTSAWVRCGLTASAAAMTSLTVLAQSRGSVGAAVAAAAVFVIASPDRRRALAHIGVVALAVTPALPMTISEFAGRAPDSITTSEPRAVAAVIVVSALAAACLTLLAARIDRRHSGARDRTRPPRVALPAILVAALIAVAAAALDGDDVDSLLAGRLGNPPSADGQRATGPHTRYTETSRSNRYDFWRVAWEDFERDPLRGTGAGGFASSYLARRHSPEYVQDPHSVEMGMLGELGLPGGMLLSVALALAFLGAARSVRAGGQLAVVGGAALAAGTAWLVQASIDWIWAYPAVTAPALGMLGLAASRPLPPRQSSRRGLTWLGVALLAGLVLTAIPAYLSVRYTEAAEQRWSASPRAALDDLNRAQTLNPLASQPDVVEGVIAHRLRADRRAAAAFRRAVELEPANWAHRYWLGKVLACDHPEAAKRQLRHAIALDPRGELARRAMQSLEHEACVLGGRGVTGWTDSPSERTSDRSM